MKPSTTLAVTVCAGAVAFFMGRWNSGAARQDERSPGDVRSSPVRRLPPRESRTAGEDAPEKSSAVCDRIPVEKAELLSSAERMKLLADGALIYNSANQAAVLCGVISALTKEEIGDATKILGGIQDRGNGITQQVWDTLYIQWGKVDPVACLSHFGKDAVSKSQADARHAMAGWLETDRGSALVWAGEPKQSPLEASAAAFAITSDAGGDVKRLESAILALPADGLTRRACLDDYFDLASLAGEDPTAATVYEKLPPDLRPAAWTVAAKRLALGDPATAKAWVTQHASDPGRNYGSISNLFNTLADQDPAGTARWVAMLPYAAEKDGIQISIYERWRERDPAAASAWLKTQPQDTSWKPKVVE